MVPIRLFKLNHSKKVAYLESTGSGNNPPRSHKHDGLPRLGQENEHGRLYISLSQISLYVKEYKIKGFS